MNNSPVYCSFDFLNKFFLSQPQSSLWPEGSDRIDFKNWLDFQGFLSRAELCMDRSFADVCNEVDSSPAGESSIYSWILNLISTGKLKAKYIKGFPDVLNPNSILLSDSINSGCCDSDGLLRISSFDVLKRDEFYVDSGLSIKKDESMSWYEIVKACLPRKRYSSLVIIDNFIYRNARENLGQLLQELLPCSFAPDKTFYITIVCVGRTLLHNEEVEIELDHTRRVPLDADSIMREYLSEFEYDIRVELLKIDAMETVEDLRGRPRRLPTNKPFHDRAIITNYNFVIAPGGLDLIDDAKSGKMTVVYGLFPDFTSDADARDQQGPLPFKVEYMYNNLYIILKNQMNQTLENPIIEQYRISYDCLWKKAEEYRSSIKEQIGPYGMDVNCLSELEHGNYNEQKHSLEVWDKNKFYQKENRIVFWGDVGILASSGCRDELDGHLNQFLNCSRLLGDYLYCIDTDIDFQNPDLENLNKGAHYLSDSLGRVKQVDVILPYNMDTARPTAGVNTKVVCEAKDGLDGDEGGHLIARSLKGPNEAINIVPMTNNVNQNLVAGIERIINGKLSENKNSPNYSLHLKISITYNSENKGLRPDSFHYCVKETLKEQILIDLVFNNQ